MIAARLLLLAALSGASATEDDEALYMVDMRVEARLPDGWRVPRWSDWDLDAVDQRETVQVHVEYTPYQLPPGRDAVKGWTGMAAERLRDQGHDRVEMVRSEAAEIDGERVGDIELRFRYEGGSDAVYRQRSFNVDGRTIHLSAAALKRNAARADEALKTWRAALVPKKPAADLDALSPEVVTEAGFTSLLPPGWRTPLDSELGWVRELAASAGQSKLEPEKCWVGIHPYPDGQAALLLSCNYTLYTGKVDEHSWSGWEAYLREHFFKGVSVPAAERISVSEDGRDGFLWTLPDNGDRAMRMAVAPYSRGHVLTYAVGRVGDAGTLDGALRAVMVSTRFTDPDGGAHPVGAWQWMSYLWTWRRGSPLVWGPALLLLGVAVALGLKLRGAGRPPLDEDDAP